MTSILLPLTRSFAQLGDPAFFGVLWRSVLLSALLFLALGAGAVWSVHQAVALGGSLGWIAGALGSVAAAILTLWLFLPIAAVIGTFYSDRIAGAVERHWYPGLPPARPAPLAQQAWDSLAVGLRVLVVNILTFPLGLIFPGVGFVLGWAMSAWVMGRLMFGAVALRRMSRANAQALHAHSWFPVLVMGGLMAAAAYVPLLNLLIPILGAAAMAHIVCLSLIVPPPGR